MRTTFSIFSVAALSLFTVEVHAALSTGAKAYINTVVAETKLLFGDTFGNQMRTMLMQAFDTDEPLKNGYT